jgi:hypothetical protein
MSKKEVKKVSKAPYNELPLHKENYMLLIAGLLIIIIGFALMCGGDKDIYNFRKMVISPIIVVFGFLFEIYAIMKKPKNKPTEI